MNFLKDFFKKKSKKLSEDDVNLLIRQKKLDGDKISDGYHTFDELYEYRKIYNAALFMEWSHLGMFDVHKSKRHYDGELCFGGDYFIVVAELPTGQISNHYELKDWNLFQIPIYETAKKKFDGHTPEECLTRIKGLYLNEVSDD